MFSLYSQILHFLCKFHSHFHLYLSAKGINNSWLYTFLLKQPALNNAGIRRTYTYLYISTLFLSTSNGYQIFLRRQRMLFFAPEFVALSKFTVPVKIAGLQRNVRRNRQLSINFHYFKSRVVDVGVYIYIYICVFFPRFRVN